MCILPKQSNELLPQSFRYYINDEKSFLRDPYDYYPDTFEEDLYGSVRSF